LIARRVRDRTAGQLPKGSHPMTFVPEFDPLSPATLENPYPVYAELQEKNPVFWHEKTGAWVITRYDDCRDVLMDSELFTRDPRRVSEVSSEADTSLRSIEAAKQAELRRFIVGAMHAQDLSQIGHSVRASIDRIFANVASRPSFDWMMEVAATLSGTITSEFLGVAEPDPAVFKAIGEGMARSFDADLGGHDPEAEGRIRAAFGALIDGWLSAPDTHGTVLTLKEQAGSTSSCGSSRRRRPPAGSRCGRRKSGVFPSSRATRCSSSSLPPTAIRPSSRGRRNSCSTATRTSTSPSAGVLTRASASCSASSPWGSWSAPCRTRRRRCG
jgi:hypothetical protein